MNEWALEIPGGDAAARQVADRHDMEFVGSIGSLPNHFLFRHRRLAKRSVDSSDEHHSRLTGDADVSWTEQQRVKRRVKRDLVGRRDSRAPVGASSSSTNKFDDFDDPLWKQQWYLQGGGIGHSDMRVREAWQQGWLGRLRFNNWQSLIGRH